MQRYLNKDLNIHAFVDIWGKHILGGGNRKWQGPAVAACSVCQRSIKEISVAGANDQEEEK